MKIKCKKENWSSYLQTVGGGNLTLLYDHLERILSDPQLYGVGVVGGYHLGFENCGVKNGFTIRHNKTTKENFDVGHRNPRLWLRLTTGEGLPCRCKTVRNIFLESTHFPPNSPTVCSNFIISASHRECIINFEDHHRSFDYVILSKKLSVIEKMENWNWWVRPWICWWLELELLVEKYLRRQCGNNSEQSVETHPVQVPTISIEVLTTWWRHHQVKTSRGVPIAKESSRSLEGTSNVNFRENLKQTWTECK